MSEHKDIAYLQMAYSLAEKARGWASPNPYVGAVIVKKGVIVGHGYHKKPGTMHAEAMALQRAGFQARSATAYITLEPCIHWGRTPPCVDSLLKARLKRVVISDLDPNPLVHRKGLKRLQAAGLPVEVGLLAAQNRRLNEAYRKLVTQKKPFLLAKAAVSLDGKIATKSYASRWISSPQSREYAHLLRGECDAIMVGINTLLRDNPQLTVRHPNWRGKRITRVILDSSLRFPATARMLDTLDKGRILVFTHRPAPPKKMESLQKRGVEVIPLCPAGSRLDLPEVLRQLGQRDISSVLVEGGGTLLTALLEQKQVDRLILIIAPKIIGGKTAPSFFRGTGVDRIQEGLKLKRVRTFRIATDIIVEGCL